MSLQIKLYLLLGILVSCKSVFAEDLLSGQTERNRTAVEYRQISRRNRFQIQFSPIGISDRQDFHLSYLMHLGIKLSLSELITIDMTEIDLAYPKESSLVREIEEKTSFRLNVKQSKVQISTGVSFVPIYGKYAFLEDYLYHFHVYFPLHIGMRLTTEDKIQPHIEVGFGIQNWLSNHFSVIPEFRYRLFKEVRSGETVYVRETLSNLGVAWTF